MTDITLDTPVVIPAQAEKTFDKLRFPNIEFKSPVQGGKTKVIAEFQPYRDLEGGSSEALPVNRVLIINNIFRIAAQRPETAAMIQAVIAELLTVDSLIEQGILIDDEPESL